MSRFILHVSALTILAIAPAFPQSTLDLFAGMHYPANQSQDVGSNLLEKFWKPSFNAGVRLTIPVYASVNLIPSVMYNHYMFDHYYTEEHYVDTEKVFVGSSGGGSDVFRIMAEFQVIDQSDNTARPYLEIGGGYVREHMGTIHGRMEYLDYLAYSSDLHFPTSSYFAYSIGVGGILSLSSALYLDFSIKQYSNTRDRSYVLFGLGMGFTLLE